MKPNANSAICPKCGGGHKSKPFCLYDNGWYCFSCHYTKAADRSFKASSKHLKSVVAIPEVTYNYNEFSLEAKKWLNSFFVDESLVYKYSIGYSSDNVLVFFMVVDGEVVCYQKRSMKERFITTQGEKTPYKLTGNVDSGVIVIVEDFISAIRVNNIGNDVLCLWGTKITRDQLKPLLKTYNKILVWLDNDHTKQINSGQIAAKQIIQQGEHFLYKNYGFSGVSRKITNVITHDDPKCYTNAELSAFVMEASK